jgi:hypothetical protein
LVVSTEHRWDAPGPKVIVRPIVGGFYLEGFDPESGEEVEYRVDSVGEALSHFLRLVAYLLDEAKCGDDHLG